MGINRGKVEIGLSVGINRGNVGRGMNVGKADERCTWKLKWGRERES